MTELLDCPFCGSEGIMHKRPVRSSAFGYEKADEYWYRVSCSDLRCFAATDEYEEERFAAEAWNTRAERTCTPTENKYSHLNCCSECGRSLGIVPGLLYSYCPGCGAKVVE